MSLTRTTMLLSLPVLLWACGPSAAPPPEEPSGPAATTGDPSSEPGGASPMHEPPGDSPVGVAEPPRPPAGRLVDRDADGIGDAGDRCPDDPEDRDGFQDEDGCPDPDNDQDGIGDASDMCPNEPEDRDRFQDEDGCPDPLHG